MTQAKVNIGLEEFVSQVFSRMRSNLLAMLKEELELSLTRLRDELIGKRKYARGSDLKRWGFTVRKYITTPLGRLERVRIPRIRSSFKEIRMFIDRYRHFSKDLVEPIPLYVNWPNESAPRFRQSAVLQ